MRLAHDNRLIANGNAFTKPGFRLHSHVNATIGVQNGVSAALAVTPSSGERLGVPTKAQACDRSLTLNQANTYRLCEYTLSISPSPLHITTSSSCLAHGSLLALILTSNLQVAEIDRYGR